MQKEETRPSCRFSWRDANYCSTAFTSIPILLVPATSPSQAMLPGSMAFSEEYVRNNYALLKDGLLIVHNNRIIGHNPKRERFRMAGLWEVDDWEFPTCQRRNLRSQGE